MARTDIVNLVYTRARDYALKAGASPQEADAFARSNLSIVHSESGFDPAIQNRQGAPAYGLYQNHLQGRGKGYTPDQLRDPETNIAISLPEMWSVWKSRGLAQTYARDPVQAVAGLSQYAQRPGPEAVQAALRSGVFQQGLQISPTGATTPGVGSAAPTAKAPQYVFPVQGYKGKVDLHWGSDKGAADLFAPAGTPVLSMADGTVEYVSSEGAGGNNVTIRGNDGRVYYYAHMIAPVALKAGQKVAAGQQIGGVGDTGNAKGTGTHLHIGIGQDINRGVGPTGGSGTNFDATTFLSQTLAGQPAQEAAVAQGPTRLQQISDALHNNWLEAQKGVAALEKQAADLRKAGKQDEALVLEATQLKAARAMTADALDAWNKMEVALSSETQAANRLAASDGGSTETESQRLAAATNFAQAATGMGRALFQDNVAAANFWAEMLNSNFAREYQQWQSAHESRKASFDEFVNVVSAQALQQTAEAARAGKALEAAGFIQKGRMELAERLLPPGTHYQRGFGPDDPLMVEMRKKGYNPEPIRVTPVDVASLDPANILKEAEGILTDTGYSRPNLDVATLRQQAEANKGLPSYQAGKLDPSQDSRLQLPDVPNYDAIFSDFVSGALGQISPQPQTPDVGSDVAQAPPLPTPTGAFGKALAKPEQAAGSVGAAVSGLATNPALATPQARMVPADQQGYSGPNSFQSGAGARNPEGGVGFNEDEWVVVGDENGRRWVRRKASAGAPT